MKCISLLAFGCALLLAACAPAPARRPADFSLELEWDTGALPPQYHYAYAVRIGPETQAQFIYSPSYEPLTQPDAWRKDFVLTPAQLDGLYALLQEHNMLRSSWATGQPLLGGSGTRLVITAHGDHFQVPSISTLQKNERDRLETVLEAIRALVPAEIWEEMQARQLQHETDFSY